MSENVSVENTGGVTGVVGRLRYVDSSGNFQACFSQDSQARGVEVEN
jgi:hypothetical protein